MKTEKMSSRYTPTKDELAQLAVARQQKSKVLKENRKRIKVAEAAIRKVEYLIYRSTVKYAKQLSDIEKSKVSKKDKWAIYKKYTAYSYPKGHTVTRWVVQGFPKIWFSLKEEALDFVASKQPKPKKTKEESVVKEIQRIAKTLGYTLKKT